MPDSHDSAVVDVLIELKQEGLEVVALIQHQLATLDDSVTDLNRSLERMADRAHQDARALLELGAAATTARGAVGGAGFLGFVSSLAMLMPGGAVMGYAILGLLGLAGAIAPMLPLLVAAVILMSAFVVGVTALATVAVLGFGGIAALAAGIVILGNRTVAGHAALQELGDDLTTMADVLSKKATPMMIQMVQWMDRFIPQLQKAGSDLINWFGARLPALFPIMTNVVNALAGSFGQVLGAIGKVIDYVITHPQFIAFFDTLVKVGTNAVVGLIANLLRLSDWFLTRLPAISAIVVPIFQGIGNVIQGIGFVLGKVVDWAIANWPNFVSAARKAADFFVAIWNNPLVQEGLKEIKKLFADVLAHLYDLQPLIPLIGAAIVAMSLVVEAGIGGLLALLRVLEAIVAAASWLIDHWSGVPGVSHGTFPGAGGRYGAGATGLPGGGVPTPYVAPGASNTDSSKRLSSQPLGGITVLPIVYGPVSPLMQQLVDQDTRERVRRLNLGQT